MFVFLPLELLRGNENEWETYSKCDDGKKKCEIYSIARTKKKKISGKHIVIRERRSKTLLLGAFNKNLLNIPLKPTLYLKTYFI